MTDTITIPTSPAELAEMLNDSKRMTAVFGDKDKFKEFIDSYARTVAPQDGVIAQQVREQTQIVLAEMLGKDGKGGKLPPVDLAGDGASALSPLPAGFQRKVSNGHGVVYNKASQGAKLEREIGDTGFTSIGEYCAAIRAQHDGAHRNYDELMAKMANVRRIMNSFGSEVPADGGFLIPEEMRSQLLQLSLEDAIVRPRATVIPMNTLRVPIPAVDDTSHVSSLFGGVVFYWTEESAALTESQAAFGKVTLDAKKLTGFFKVPNELLADAVAFGAWFDSRIPAGLAYYEDLAFLTETGAGTPLGVIGVNNPAYVAATRATHNIIAYADIVGMYARMLPSSLRSAVWIASIDTFPQLAQMTLATPGVWMGGYNVPGAADAPPISIFGRPVYFTEKTNQLGSTGDLSFVDLSYYLIGDRQMAQISASEHFAFQNDQTVYRIIERVDGRPWVQSPLTPHNGSNTLSPFVGLTAP